jgi:hypothetical protein
MSKAPATTELKPHCRLEIRGVQDNANAIEYLIPDIKCWGLVLKCYELRTRQHKMLNVNALRPLKHYFFKGLMNFGRRLKTVQLRRLNLRN